MEKIINLLDYYDVTFTVNGRIPNIKLKLKNKFKNGKSPIFKPTGQPISGSEIAYYINYLGEDIGKLVYNERKKLFSKNILCNWYLDNFDVCDTNAKIIQEYLLNYGKTISDGLLEHYRSPAGNITKEKLRLRNEKYAKIVGELNSNKWKTDAEWRERQMARYTPEYREKLSNIQKLRWTPEYKEWYIKNVANEKSRVEKISQAAKKMWVESRINNLDRYYAMISNFKNKKFECNGIMMNSCEYLLAKILNNLNLNWRYEKIFNFNGSGFLPDFYISDHNLIVECYGDFWHANPSTFKKTDYVHTGKYASDIWEYDNNKKYKFEVNGYKYLYFWECDIKNNETYVVNTIINTING